MSFLDAGFLQWIFPKLILYSWDCVLDIGEVTHPRIGSSLGISRPRNFVPSFFRGGYLNFNSVSAKIFFYNMNLKNWSNYRSFRNGSIDSGIRVCTRVYVLSLSACWSLISKTIIYISNCFVAHSNRNSILTKSCKLDFFLQCLKVLNAFSHPVSGCGLVVPWSLYQRIYFLRSHFFQYFLIFCLRKPF